MEKLQNRSTAWLITICVVVGSVLLGSSISLNKEREHVLSLYYDSRHDAAHHSVESDLQRLAADSSNLLVVAQRYLAADDPYVSGVARARELLETADGPQHAATASAELYAALQDLDTHLRTLALSSDDQSYQRKLMANLNATYRTLQASGYNSAAVAFNQTLAQFPANLLARIVGVEPLELYE